MADPKGINPPIADAGVANAVPPFELEAQHTPLTVVPIVNGDARTARYTIPAKSLEGCVATANFINETRGLTDASCIDTNNPLQGSKVLEKSGGKFRVPTPEGLR